MNVAIIEDNPIESNRLRNIIIKWGENKKIKYEIYSYSSGEDFLAAKDGRPKFSVIFLDIEMSGSLLLPLLVNMFFKDTMFML